MAARFPRRREAFRVLDLLHRQLRIDPPDVAVAPLGIPGQPPADDTVLAGRFPDEQAPAVVDLVRRAGGEVVADLDERWTRPTPADVRPSRSEQRGGTTMACMANRSRMS